MSENTTSKKKLLPIIISGPTCVGKTEFTLELAKALNTDIISADSVQVYKELNIGSAKPDAQILNSCKHHCLDLVAPNITANVSDWLNAAYKAKDYLNGQNRTCIFSGGTTMYLSSLLSGLHNLPAADIDLRNQLELKSSEELYDLLKKLSPIKAKSLHLNDRIRVIRAIELEYANNTVNMSSFKYVPLEPAIIIVLLKPRSDLYKDINQRTKEMLKNGLIDEARELFQKYGDVKALKSVGYKQCLDFFKGNIKDLENLEAEIAQATRNYAKRQMTFWRNEPLKRKWNVNNKLLELIIKHDIKNELCSFDKFNKIYKVDLSSSILLASELVKEFEVKTNEICYFSIV